LKFPCMYIIGILALTAEHSESAVAKDQLTSIIINNTNWPPILYENTEKVAIGFGKEIIEICVKESGYDPDFKPISIKRMYNSMKMGSSDINIFSHKDERDEFVYYSKEPLFKAQYKPFVRKTSKITINKIEDFDQLRLGHLSGIKYSPKFFEYIEKRKAAGTLEEVDTDNLNLKKLLADRIDVFVATEASTKWFANRRGLLGHIKALDYVVKSSDYFIAVSKKTTRIKDPKNFLNKMDTCFKKLKSDGTYKKIQKQYGLL